MSTYWLFVAALVVFNVGFLFGYIVAATVSERDQLRALEELREMGGGDLT